MELSHDQEKALNTLIKWITTENNNRYITLGGYAGTGKTTLISILRKYIHEKIDPTIKIAFCSYTGRAVQVLKSTLTNSKAIYSQDIVSTIHGLIYSPMVNSEEEIVGWNKKEDLEAELVIVDEASMINADIWRDLLTYGIPIIALGDHGQLPPIEGQFNLMEKPMLRLEEIHRQAEDNPIIDVSILARKKGKIPAKDFGNNVIKYDRTDLDTQSITNELLQNYSEDTIILCGYNTTRNKINQFIRNSLGFESNEPMPGDRVICLRNNHEKQIYNGMLGNILSIREKNAEWYSVEISMDDMIKPYRGNIYRPQFGAPTAVNFTKDRKLVKQGDLFDFGYALTVHKSQGSQAKKVILFEERFKQMDDDMWKKWLYTGVTRAQEELFIIG